MTSDSLLQRLPLGDARLASQGGPPARHRRANLWLVAGLTALAAIGYSVFSLLQQHTVRTHAYDLVIFDQAVRSYAHFQPGISPLKGYHNGFGPDFSVLGDHWSEFTLPNVADQITRVNLLKAHGYVTVYSAGGCLVMHKPGIKA